MDDYEQRLYAFLVTLLNDVDAAADCAQETFVQAYRHLSRRKPVTIQWLYRVARNRAMDEHRRRKREERTQTQLRVHTPLGSGTNSSSTAVRRALAALSPDDREVLYLFVVDGFSGEEIGALLGARPDAIRMRISRARQRFRVAFGEGL
jgi:RNA polymerase sigma-70 factor (ECF subfamily)